MDSGRLARWTLTPDLTAPARARQLTGQALTGTPDDTVDTAQLLVTEIVSNAVAHGVGPVDLVIETGPHEIRVSVHDHGPGLPMVVAPPPLSEFGRGLHIVQSLADDWGVDPGDGDSPGKHVWFRLHR